MEPCLELRKDYRMKGKPRIKKSSREKSWFWIPFALTISLLVLFFCMAVVDVRCRQMGLGDYTPAVSMQTAIGGRTLLHIDILGVEGDLDITLVDNLVEYVEEKLQFVITGGKSA